MLKVKKCVGNDFKDPLSSTLQSSDHRDLDIHVELGGDGQLHGDDDDREHLVHAGKQNRGVAAGKPVGYKDDTGCGKVDQLGGLEPQGGAGHPNDHHCVSLHSLCDANPEQRLLQEDTNHPLAGLPHGQHDHHDHHLYLLDIHCLLHRFTDGHHIPPAGWPGDWPVDSHVEGGVALLPCAQGE